MSRGDYSAAVQHCSQLVKVAADSYEGWFNLGVAYQKTGRLEQAGNAYREATRIRPDAVEANANLGAVLQERGDLAGARRAYERVLGHVAGSARRAVEPGAGGRARRQTATKPKSYFEKLVAVKPDFEDAAFRLGLPATAARRIRRRGGQLRNLPQESARIGWKRC